MSTKYRQIIQLSLSLRSALQTLLKFSSHYNASLLLSKIPENSGLNLETAMLYGRVSNDTVLASGQYQIAKLDLKSKIPALISFPYGVFSHDVTAAMLVG